MLRCFMDYYNALNVLQDNESFHLLDLNLSDLVAEIAEEVGEMPAPMHRGFAGVHSRAENLKARDKLHRVTTALKYKQHFEFYTRDFAYLETNDGFKEAREKGIDVRIGCELMMAALDPEVSSVLLWSCDQDLSEAVIMAKSLAASMGKNFEVYCLHVEGTYPVKGGVPVLLTRTMLYRHKRWDEVEACSCGETTTAIG